MLPDFLSCGFNDIPCAKRVIFCFLKCWARTQNKPSLTLKDVIKTIKLLFFPVCTVKRLELLPTKNLLHVAKCFWYLERVTNWIYLLLTYTDFRWNGYWNRSKVCLDIFLKIDIYLTRRWRDHTLLLSAMCLLFISVFISRLYHLSHSCWRHIA